IEMLYEWRFSTSTWPLRSKTTPRGARSASVRWLLFSASSAYFSCCATWRTQNPTASTENSRATRYCSTPRRIVTVRRSSARAMAVPYILAVDPAFCGTPPFDGPGEQLSQLKGHHPHHRVARRLTRDRGVRRPEMAQI